MSLAQIAIAGLLGLSAAIVARRLQMLTSDGALAAGLLGTLVLGFGGWVWAGLLLAFFISSSLLSKRFKRRKSRAESHYAKGSQRDWAQVAANGGVGALFVILNLLFPGNLWPWIGFAAALAAVNADTWATELGGLSSRSPRLITTGRVVSAGTSGGVSLAGSAAALAGAGLIAALAVMMAPSTAGWPVGLLIIATGWLGAMLDSLLGATVQVMYRCPSCDSATESEVHHCGTESAHQRGFRWLNNDAVNAIAALAAGFGAASIAASPIVYWAIFSGTPS